MGGIVGGVRIWKVSGGVVWEGDIGEGRESEWEVRRVRREKVG